jgi:hypothetical protein
LHCRDLLLGQQKEWMRSFQPCSMHFPSLRVLGMINR